MTLSTVKTVFKCYMVQKMCVKKINTCLENVCLQGYYMYVNYIDFDGLNK